MKNRVPWLALPVLLAACSIGRMIWPVHLAPIPDLARRTERAAHCCPIDGDG